MKRSGLIAMLARLLAAALVSGLLLHLWPGAVLTPMAWIAGHAGGWTSPWLSGVVASVEQETIRFEGWIAVDMELHGGTPVAPEKAFWQANGSKYLILGVVVFTVWATPADRRRWAALPIAFLGLLGVGALYLSLEMQRAALKVIGYEWLPTLSFANVPLNHETFARLEQDYLTLEWAISFLNGGGFFFLGVLAGWLGYTLPEWATLKKTSAHLRNKSNLINLKTNINNAII